MKRIFLTLCILVSSAACAWADDLAMAGPHAGHSPLLATSMNTLHTILGGVVKSITGADPVKGTKSEIVVTDAARKTIPILVTSTTTLWDVNAKAVMPDKIAARSHVNVIYLTTPEGINIGKSIKILK